MSRGAGTVRIEAGSLRGRALRVPPGARPSSGRLRGALFSIWAERIAGARFLDLFAGSGAVGLEAISRGAFEAVFVESSRSALALLQRNLEPAPPGSARIVRGELPQALERLAARAERFDLVFADPPYARPPGPALFEALERVSARDALLAVEHARRAETEAEAGIWVRTGIRRYGESSLSLYARAR